MPHQILIDVPLPEETLAMFEPDDRLHIWSESEPEAIPWAALDAVFTYSHPPVDGPLMDRMPDLKVISNVGVGVDHIDLAAARDRKIPVGNTPNLLDGATADMTFALLLAAARGVAFGDRYARSPAFTHFDPGFFLGQEVHGATLGIVGLGNIGFQVGRRALGFDMKILYHNRKPNPKAETELGAVYRSLPELLSASDYVTLHVPLTPQTEKLIGRAELRQMKPTASLINMARGGVVDHQALVAALNEGWLYHAALDVTEPEPLPRDHPLLTMENVTIMPHLGSATYQTRRAMAQRAIDNLRAGLAGEPLLSRIA